MTHVDVRPLGPEYDHWSRRAKAARDKLVEEWTVEREAAVREGRAVDWKPKFDTKLYRQFRGVFLFAAFSEKCAYCEVKHTDGYPIQVEHYRPKAGVTEKRRPIQHAGYFWLAYEWWNLIPSCAHCNTNHTDPQGAAHPGKKNEFPIDGVRVIVPSDNPEAWFAELEAERASLLNPYFDQPEGSIDFDPSTGAAVPKCPRGKATIEICDLNRPSLRDKRLSLRQDALFSMLKRLVFDLEDLDSIVPASSELSLWRRKIVQDHARHVPVRAHLTEAD